MPEKLLVDLTTKGHEKTQKRIAEKTRMCKVFLKRTQTLDFVPHISTIQQKFSTVIKIFIKGFSEKNKIQGTEDEDERAH